MTDKIEPALTAEQWASLREGPLRHMSLEAVAAVLSEAWGDDEKYAPRIIAAMNDRLSDSDPRKITRETVTRIRAIGNALIDKHDNWDAKGFLLDLADALESYLPPER